MAKEATIGHLIEVIKAENQESRSETKSNTAQLVTLNKTMSDYFKSLQADKLDNLEKERESKAKSGGKEGASKFSGMVGDAKGFGFGRVMVAGILAIARDLAIGAVEGFGDAVTIVLKGLRGLFRLGLKPIRAIFGDININLLDKFKSLGKTVRGFRLNVPLTPFIAIREIFEDLGRGINKTVDVIKSIGTRVLNPINKVVGNFTLGFSREVNNFGKVATGSVKDFSTFAGKFGAAIRSIGDMPEINRFVTGVRSLSNSVKGLLGFGRVAERAADTAKATAGFFSRVGGLFRSLATALGSVLGVFRTLGRVVFFPLALIMTVMDSIKGAIEGFEQEGILGGIFGAIGGALSGLIGMPLDLLKSGIAWIADKLGFENFAETLESFSIADMIKDMFMKVASLLNDAFGWIGRKIASVFGLESAEEPEAPEEPKEKSRSEMNRFERTKDNQRRERERLEGKKSGQGDKLKPVERTEQGDVEKKPMNRYDRIQARVAREREATQRAQQGGGGGVVAVNSPTSVNTANNTAVYSDPTPATDDLDRAAFG